VEEEMLSKAEEEITPDAQQTPRVTKTVTIEVERVVKADALPVSIHHFVLTRVGALFQLEGGFFDLVDWRIVLEAAREGKEAKLKMYVPERFILNRETLVQLRDAANELLTRFEEEDKDAGAKHAS
jgi:hypothetical protein